MPTALERTPETIASATSLIERIKAGDGEAFTELYDAYHGRIISTVKRYITEPDIAEHVANGVFIRVWQVRNTPANWKGGSSLATWLTRIAINVAQMYIRETKNDRQQIAYSLDATHTTDNDGSTIEGSDFATRDTDLEGIFDRKEMAYVLMKLPSVYRKVIVMRFVDEMTNEEICDALNLKITVVKSRLFRGRKMMQGLLQKKISKSPKVAVY